MTAERLSAEKVNMGFYARKLLAEACPALLGLSELSKDFREAIVGRSPAWGKTPSPIEAISETILQKGKTYKISYKRSKVCFDDNEVGLKEELHVAKDDGEEQSGFSISTGDTKSGNTGSVIYIHSDPKAIYVISDNQEAVRKTERAIRLLLD